MTTAVVLAGGLGTRMRPLTDRRPKPGLLVAATPLIGRQLHWLAHSDVRHAVIATGYRAELLQEVVDSGNGFGSAVTYVTESTPLGTGGALALACRSLPADQVVVVVNGDQLTHHDLRAQLEQFSRTDADVSIHARQVADARPFGLLELRGDRIVSFREKPTEVIGGWVNSGTYVLRAGLLHDVIPMAAVSLEREVFPALIADDRVIVAYREDAYSLDVGSPQALRQASLDVVSATGAPCRMDGSAADTAVVSDHSWVGSGTVVGAHSRVIASVVMPDVIIEDGVTITGSVIAQGALLKAGIVLQDNVIGEDAVLHRSPEPGEVVGTGVVLR
ncbi:NDP-sugar synthase [Yimella sp. cx-573]|nr:NDP-sugar synthase [Yimella sp. cx-573]